MARPHVRDFLEKFVRPLVAGGELHIGAPIPVADVDRWEHELDNASVEQVAVDDARTTVLSTLVVRPPASLTTCAAADGSAPKSTASAGSTSSFASARLSSELN